MTRHFLRGWRISGILGLITAAFLMIACEHKTINQIKADPARYARHEVGITGRVVDSYSVMRKGAYMVDDGTGRLWVVSDRGVPRKGARVAVKGRIRDAFELGSVVKLPEVMKSGMVMIESDHRAR
jgi:hypothetical protein